MSIVRIIVFNLAAFQLQQIFTLIDCYSYINSYSYYSKLFINNNSNRTEYPFSDSIVELQPFSVS